jgi:hypothetical protein
MRGLVPVCAVLLGGCLACSRGEGTYTLYRNEASSDTTRLHVATFDAEDGEGYNHDACEQTRELFQVQPSTRAKYWCEKGTFRRKQ